MAVALIFFLNVESALHHKGRSILFIFMLRDHIDKMSCHLRAYVNRSAKFTATRRPGRGLLLIYLNWEERNQVVALAWGYTLQSILLKN